MPLTQKLGFRFSTAQKTIMLCCCCGCGEIGRRTRFRIWRRKAWGFKSLHPHKEKKGSEKSEPFFVPFYLALSYRYGVGLVVNFDLVRPAVNQFSGFNAGCVNAQAGSNAPKERTLRIIGQLRTLIPGSGGL